MKPLALFLAIICCAAPLHAAVGLDGIDDRLSIPTSPVIEQTTAQNSLFTVSFWMTPNSAGSSTFGIVYFKGTVASNKFLVIGFSPTNAMSIFLTGTVNMRLATQNNSIILGRPVNVVVTVNMTGTALDNHIYLDGVEGPYGTTTDAVLPQFPTNLPQTMGDADDGSNPFDGPITEFAMWNKWLSIDEIKILALSKVKRMPEQISPLNLVAYRPFDDYDNGRVLGSTDFLMDCSSNALNATPINLPTMKPETVLSYP